MTKRLGTAARPLAVALVALLLIAGGALGADAIAHAALPGAFSPVSDTTAEPAESAEPTESEAPEATEGAEAVESEAPEASEDARFETESPEVTRSPAATDQHDGDDDQGEDADEQGEDHDASRATSEPTESPESTDDHDGGHGDAPSSTAEPHDD
jgi:hypothetical protein